MALSVKADARPTPLFAARTSAPAIQGDLKHSTEEPPVDISQSHSLIAAFRPRSRLAGRFYAVTPETPRADPPVCASQLNPATT